MAARGSGVLFVGGSETLLPTELSLRRRGVRVDRLSVLENVPTDPTRLRRALAKFGRYDVLLLTSKDAVGVMANVGGLGGSPTPYRRIVAGGPAVVRALSRRRRWVCWDARWGIGSAVVARIPGRGRMRIVYPRSDRAGPGVARGLRAQGHVVLDLIAYRVRPNSQPGGSVSGRLRSADRVVVTSPSALSFLRRLLPHRDFQEFRRRRSLVVLGEKSARSARGHGFRAVRIAPALTGPLLFRFLREGPTDDP